MQSVDQGNLLDWFLKLEGSDEDLLKSIWTKAGQEREESNTDSTVKKFRELIDSISEKYCERCLPDSDQRPTLTDSDRIKYHSFVNHLSRSQESQI